MGWDSAQFESRFDPSGKQFKQKKHKGNIKSSFNTRMPVPDSLPGENVDIAFDLCRDKPDSCTSDAAVPSNPSVPDIPPVYPVPPPDL